jgi:predicted acyltransferase
VRSIAGPLTARKLSILPVFEITASITTMPSVRVAFAIAGYTGTIGAINIPAETPEDTGTGPCVLGLAATIFGPAPVVPMPVSSPSDMPNLMGIPGVIVGSVPGTAMLMPWSILGAKAVGAILTTGALIAVEDEAASSIFTCTTGGLGAGTESRGASAIMGKISGRMSGIAIRIAATPHCKTTEPSAVQRFVPDAGNPCDSTKVPSNIRHLLPSARCASARNASVTQLDTPAAQRFPRNPPMSDDGSSMNSTPARAPQRVLAIDVLRGITIAFMILVNDPGDWDHVYSQLDHAKWNGFTCTDLVFPSFLFLVGASIIFSLQSRLARGESKRTLALHIIRRAAILFAIKMFLTAFPHFHWTHLRIYGVLTRIATCYLAAGLICLVTQRARTLVAITAALLLGYWVLMRFVPVPGFGVPTHDIPILDPDNNLAAWLDRIVNAFTQRWFHTGRLYETTRDPEGLLSTLPAIATTLIGSLAALRLRRVQQLDPSTKARRRKPRNSERNAESQPSTYIGITPAYCLSGLASAGILSLTIGFLWNVYFPINKNLWTSSFVLYAAGWSLLLLALFYWLIDIRHFNETKAGKMLLFPWLVFGSNAITAFVLSNFLVELMLWIKVPGGALVDPADPSKPISAWLWTYRHLFARHESTEVTSLAFALAFVALCFLPNLFLWRKKIFLKI